MALSFPLATADFLDLLPITEISFQISDQVQATGLGSGEILTAEVAPPLWSGSISLAPMKQRRAADIEARLAALSRPGRAFFCYKTTQIGPAADPIGATLGASAPVLAEIDTGTASLRLGGLPVGYAITAGDLLAFPYGTPTRYALHRAAGAAVADGLGETGFLEVVPPIRAGAAVSAAVALVRPKFKAVIVPGSIDYGTTRAGTVSGISFSFRQTLR